MTDQDRTHLGVQMIVHPNLEQNPFELDPNRTEQGVFEEIGLVPNGTSGGRASVAVVVRLPGGRKVVGQTTYRAFAAAARALAVTPLVEDAQRA